MKIKKVWKVATIVLILTLLLNSCTSIPKSNDGIVPDPIIDGVSVVTYDEVTDTVTMPFWYWKKIVRYVIDSSE